MSLRDLLTTQPSGEIEIDLAPDPNFEVKTSIDALLPDLQVGTPAGDSFSGDQGGPPVDVSFEIEIEFITDPDIPLTLPNTPNDILFGFGGDDVINGDAGGGPDGPGNDLIFGDGLAPNDAGADGNDFLNGEGGNDIVFGGGANDSLFGADGTDILVGDYFLGFNIYDVNLNPNDLDFIPDNVNIDSPNPIQFSIGSGNEGNDFLSGGNGDDILGGDRNNDTLQGDAGKDIVVGGGDSDLIYGGQDDDLLIGDYIIPPGQLDLDFGPLGNDSISGGLGNDIITGDGGNDNITGDEGKDLILGGADGDTISGGDDDDIITGDYLLPPGYEVPLGADGNNIVN
jgi:Ca2+-binding RTX toxin-like protein